YQSGDLKLDVVSPVKGMNFAMIELKSLEELAAVTLPGTEFNFSLDADWNVGPCFSKFFVRMPDQGDGVRRLRTRMIEGSFEDPATGSACCGLAAYLVLQEGIQDGKVKFDILQAVEIGRPSEIGVEIEVKGGEIKTVVLSGMSVSVMEGKIFYDSVEPTTSDSIHSQLDVQHFPFEGTVITMANIAQNNHLQQFKPPDLKEKRLKSLVSYAVAGLRECKHRPSICSCYYEHIEALNLDDDEDFDDHDWTPSKTSRRARFELVKHQGICKELYKILHQDDLLRNPYLTWSNEILIASLKQRGIALPRARNKSAYA
ncbi:Diaminopimelate epimerase-like protein, partial [Aureobasidium melanogenum]